MKVLIMGCGRVGSELAALLDAKGHRVTVLDVDSATFAKLPANFSGVTLLSDGTDEDSLRAAGIEQMDAFVAVTREDNRNIMSAQIAKHIFNLPKVVCRIYDPLREELYQALDLEAITPTKILAQILEERLLK